MALFKIVVWAIIFLTILQIDMNIKVHMISKHILACIIQLEIIQCKSPQLKVQIINPVIFVFVEKKCKKETAIPW